MSSNEGRGTLHLRDSADLARQHNGDRAEVSAPHTGKRVPVDGRRDVLTVAGKDDGYHYRWVNDTADNIQRHQKGWYEFVTHTVTIGDEDIKAAGDGSPVSKPVGQGITAFLMRIKKEYFEEDQAAFNKRVDESEEDLFRGLNDGQDGKYGSVTRSR